MQSAVATECNLNAVTGEFNAKKLETAFRDFGFEQRKRGIQIFCLFGMFALFVFSLIEFFLVNPNHQFVQVQVGRLGMILALLLVLSILRRTQNRVRFETIAFWTILVIPLLATLVKYYRPTLDGGYFIFDIILLLSYFLFFHLPFRIQFIPPVLLTIAQLFLLYTQVEVDSSRTIFVIALALVMTNVIGYFAYRQANIKARQFFIKYRAESELRTQLQKTMDRLELLEGLVPICCHCKRIKDDKGSWESVEEFVERGSKVLFSHGICPDCFNKHY